jgi:hypothetical protein
LTVSHAEFVRLVKTMRALQIRFFSLKSADRPPQLIRDATNYERQVDRAIKAFDDAQGRLFGEAPDA